MKDNTHLNPESKTQGRACCEPVEAEEEGELESSWREGRGLEPLIIQPSVKKEIPASIAVPQACEYHLLYCLMANLHWSRSVAGSGFWISGGFGYRTLWPVNSAFGPPLLISFGILGEGEGPLEGLDSVMVLSSNFAQEKEKKKKITSQSSAIFFFQHQQNRRSRSASAQERLVYEETTWKNVVLLSCKK